MIFFGYGIFVLGNFFFGIFHFQRFLLGIPRRVRHFTFLYRRFFCFVLRGLPGSPLRRVAMCKNSRQSSESSSCSEGFPHPHREVDPWPSNFKVHTPPCPSGSNECSLDTIFFWNSCDVFFFCFDDFVDGMLLLLLLFRWKLDPISPKKIPGPSAWNDPHHEGGYHCISPSELFEWMLHVSTVCPAFTPQKKYAKHR